MYPAHLAATDCPSGVAPSRSRLSPTSAIPMPARPLIAFELRYSLTAVLVILALIVNWPLTARRRSMSGGAILFFVMLAWTVVYYTYQRRYATNGARRRWPRRRQ